MGQVGLHTIAMEKFHMQQRANDHSGGGMSLSRVTCSEGLRIV
jgi:hypothetical protein